MNTYQTKLLAVLNCFGYQSYSESAKSLIRNLTGLNISEEVNLDELIRRFDLQSS